MTQTQVSGSGIKNNVITNNHLHSAANIAGSKLADSGVTAGSYGSSSATLSLTINAKGLITAASTNAITQVGGSNGVDFNDNVKARFGTGNDLSLYHDGSNSYINNTTGTLFYLANTHYFTNPAVSEIQATFVKDGAVNLYFNGSKKFETTNTGATLTGKIDVTGNVDLTDNGRLVCGDADDLQIYHNGSGSFIDAYTNNLQIRNDNSELMAEFKRNLAVDLYYDGTKRLSTHTYGAVVNGHTFYIRGGSGEDSVLQFIANNSASYNDHYNFRVAATGAFSLQTEVNANQFENLITATQHGNVELFHDNSKRFETTSGGGILTGHFFATQSASFGATSLDPDSYNASSGGFGGIQDGSGWSARGLFVHGGGTGDAAAIGHNGNNLYFGIQDGANANSMETWLQVTPNSRVISFQTDDNNNNVRVGSHKIFHAGNDGSGSGLDADTVDGIQGSSFARSDQDDTMSGSYTLSKDATDVINFSANAASNSRGISFNNRTALSAGGSNNWLRLNNDSEFTEGTYTPKLFRADGGFLTGTGSYRLAIKFDGTFSDTSVGHNTSHNEGIFWHNNANYGIYRTAGNWSGNYQQLRIDWPTGIIIDGGTQYGLSGCRFDCHALPTTNNTFDLGTSSLRWRNVYTNDLNLSNEGGANDVDGTWGSFTIQEGLESLFLINRRNGKKYKFNLTEID